MALKTDIELLTTVPLFDAIGEDRLRLIAFGAEKRRLTDGQVLFREGTPADCAYVVVDGIIDLTRHDQRSNIVTIGSAERGALLGEVAMISAVRRHMTATARGDTELIRITRTLFQRMLEEYPDIADMLRQRITGNFAAMLGGLSGLAPRFRD